MTNDNEKVCIFLSDPSLQLMLTTEQIAVLCYILESSQSSQIQTAMRNTPSLWIFMTK